jgi:hypothetical protein
VEHLDGLLELRQVHDTVLALSTDADLAYAKAN